MPKKQKNQPSPEQVKKAFKTIEEYLESAYGDPCWLNKKDPGANLNCMLCQVWLCYEALADNVLIGLED